MHSDSSEKNNAWYCLRTKPRQEAVATQQLCALGVEVFSPRIRFRRPRGRSVAWVNEALFPGYFFASFDYSKQHRQIAATQGIAKIIGFGQVPFVVTPSLINELRSSLTEENIMEISCKIMEGENVSIVQGPFSGIQALVTRLLPSRQRVAVLFELLGQEREIEVELDSLLLKKQHPLIRNSI
jgi:transcriptional antiterminator RfaH